MKNKGFTLVELLAIIILLGVLVLIVYPKILEVIEKKNSEIDKATLDIFYSAADEYMKKNPNDYSKTIGDTYCFNITDLDSENLIPIDIAKYKDKGIQVKIGEKNSYKLTKCN